MGIELILGIIAASLSAFIGGLFTLLTKVAFPASQKYYDKNPDSTFSKFLTLFFRLEKENSKSYQERISDSLKNLKNATLDIDKVVEEIGSISKEKQETIAKLETELKTLEEKEITMKERIGALEKVPIEAVKHFEDILKRGDKRSARRDYLLFIGGVVVTTIIAIILNLIK